jgi:hypothetical protein
MVSGQHAIEKSATAAKSHRVYILVKWITWG